MKRANMPELISWRRLSPPDTSPPPVHRVRLQASEYYCILFGGTVGRSFPDLNSDQSTALNAALKISPKRKE